MVKLVPICLKLSENDTHIMLFQYQKLLSGFQLHWRARGKFGPWGKIYPIKTDNRTIFALFPILKPFSLIKSTQKRLSYDSLCLNKQSVQFQVNYMKFIGFTTKTQFLLQVALHSYFFLLFMFDSPFIHTFKNVH